MIVNEEGHFYTRRPDLNPFLKDIIYGVVMDNNEWDFLVNNIA